MPLPCMQAGGATVDDSYASAAGVCLDNTMQMQKHPVSGNQAQGCLHRTCRLQCCRRGGRVPLRAMPAGLLPASPRCPVPAGSSPPSLSPARPPWNPWTLPPPRLPPPRVSPSRLPPPRLPLLPLVSLSHPHPTQPPYLRPTPTRHQTAGATPGPHLPPSPQPPPKRRCRRRPLAERRAAPQGCKGVRLRGPSAALTCAVSSRHWTGHWRLRFRQRPAVDCNRMHENILHADRCSMWPRRHAQLLHCAGQTAVCVFDSVLQNCGIRRCSAAHAG